ncbi:MAG: ARMT1-like domain-containing protein [Nitrospirota bacterium]
MRVYIDCFPCFIRQSIIALRLGTKDESLQESILKSTLEYIEKADTSKPPAYTTTFIHRKIRQMLGRDPFKDIKSEYNQIALRLYSSLKAAIEKSSDPLWTSTRLAIAGNVIDFGIFTSVDIEGAITRALNDQIAVDDYAFFKEAISNTNEILYLTDNAGEIVFDRLLIETLTHLGKEVKAIVKGSPVINDCTMEDAKESGLANVCEIADNGSDAVGTILQWTSSAFQKTFENAPLIISKGQGNFETLSSTEKKIFFLFQAKCDVVSKELDLSTCSMLFKKS